MVPIHGLEPLSTAYKAVALPVELFRRGEIVA